VGIAIREAEIAILDGGSVSVYCDCKVKVWGVEVEVHVLKQQQQTDS
jgi:hypothetical protein